MNVKGIAAAVSTVIVFPIWFYLLHQVLVRINASELMWFLFWVYVPAAAFVRLVADLATKGES